MFKKTIFLTIASLFVLSSIKAQRHYPHSLAVGLVNNLAQIDDHQTTTGFSLDLNHQRNLGRFFALRTELMSSYFFPVTRSWLFLGDDPNTGYTNYKTNYTHLGLSFTPMAYYRHKKFSFFAGLGGGIGMQLEKRKTYIVYPDEHDLQESRPTEYYFQLGWKPLIGFSYKFEPGDSARELELTLSRQDWWTVVDGPKSSNFIWYGLEIAYRFNFKKG